jgi:selenocysteine-specific translation elongation factor
LNHLVAVPLDPTLAEFIGKKNTTNGIDFYNRKTEDGIITVLAPSNITEKFFSAVQPITFAEHIVVSTRTIDSVFGEILLACSVLGKKVIFTDDNDVSKIISSLKIEHVVAQRGGILDLLTKPNGGSSEELRIDIDKAFPVKGIGTVVLGIVTKGAVNAHDKVYHGMKQIEIKSIQSQDEDIKQAGLWTRVGLALKGAEHSEIDKGDIFTYVPMKKVTSIEARIKLSPMAEGKPEIGKVYGFTSGFNYTNASIAEIKKEAVVLKLDREISLQKGDCFLLLQERTPRIFGGGKITAVDR